MMDAGRHAKISLMTYSEVEEVSGYVGNFRVRVRKKPRYVDESSCTGCGICWTECLTRRIPRFKQIESGGLSFGERRPSER
jgi:heterodisulfide reductase subunit A